jgi:hypothetical protein
MPKREVAPEIRDKLLAEDLAYAKEALIKAEIRHGKEGSDNSLRVLGLWQMAIVLIEKDMERLGLISAKDRTTAVKEALYNFEAEMIEERIDPNVDQTLIEEASVILDSVANPRKKISVIGVVSTAIKNREPDVDTPSSIQSLVGRLESTARDIKKTRTRQVILDKLQSENTQAFAEFSVH